VLLQREHARIIAKRNTFHFRANARERCAHRFEYRSAARDGVVGRARGGRISMVYRGYCYRTAITTGRVSSRSIGVPHLTPPHPDTSRDAAHAGICERTGILGETFVYLDDDTSICRVPLPSPPPLLPVRPPRCANVWSLLRCLIIREEWNLGWGREPSKESLSWK